MLLGLLGVPAWRCAPGGWGLCGHLMSGHTGRESWRSLCPLSPLTSSAKPGAPLPVPGGGSAPCVVRGSSHLHACHPGSAFSLGVRWNASPRARSLCGQGCGSRTVVTAGPPFIGSEPGRQWAWNEVARKHQTPSAPYCQAVSESGLAGPENEEHFPPYFIDEETGESRQSDVPRATCCGGTGWGARMRTGLWPQGLSRDCSGVPSPSRWVNVCQMAELESRSLPTRAKFCAPSESGKWVSRRVGVLEGLAPSGRLRVPAREAEPGGEGDPRWSPGPARRGAVPGPPLRPVQPASPAPGSRPCASEKPARPAASAAD